MADLTEGALAQSIRNIWAQGANDREMLRDSLLVIVSALDKINWDGCAKHVRTCDRIHRLENWRIWLVGGFVGAGVAGGAIGWLIEKAWAVKETIAK
jgi:hypothetical protein